MTFRHMKFVILFVLSYMLPKIHKSKAPAPKTLQKTTPPSYPYSSKILQTMFEAKELWLPVWVSSNYLSFKINCVGASCNDGNAVSNNVSFIQLRKHYFLILDAWNTSLIRLSLSERTQLKLYYTREKNGGGGKELGKYLSRESWIIQWKKCIIHHVTLKGSNLDIRPFKNTEHKLTKRGQRNTYAGSPSFLLFLLGVSRGQDLMDHC